mmetsp:Transcript_18864/g.37047  ORF Transcript_18864/g.37047 Transcript_18864/m.37047 type:complete len:331 (-) Transcript_18864:1343-2335(-)
MLLAGWCLVVLGLRLLELAHELLGFVRRHGLVSLELHGELALGLGGGADLGGVAKHLLERNLAVDGGSIVLHVGVENRTTAAVDSTNDGTLVLFGDLDLDVHDGLENHRVCLGHGLAESATGSKLESQLVGIDGVSRTIQKNNLDAHERVSNKRSLLHGLLETLLNSRDVLGRNRVSDHLVYKLELNTILALLLGERLNVTLDTTKLSRSTRLLLVEVVEVSAMRNSLTVVHLRHASNSIYLVLAAHALQVHLEVEFSHTRDDGLLALLVNLDTEGRVLTHKSVKGLSEVTSCISHVLGLDGKAHNGFRDIHGHHGGVKVLDVSIAESIS